MPYIHIMPIARCVVESLLRRRGNRYKKSKYIPISEMTFSITPLQNTLTTLLQSCSESTLGTNDLQSAPTPSQAPTQSQRRSMHTQGWIKYRLQTDTVHHHRHKQQLATVAAVWSLTQIEVPVDWSVGRYTTILARPVCRIAFGRSSRSCCRSKCPARFVFVCRFGDVQRIIS